MGFIPEDIIRQILDRSDIVDIIGSYIPLKRAGQNFKAACPFHHEKTPSFMVNPKKQIYHCFGCGVGGNAISFVMAQDHLSFPEAVRQLAQRADVVIPEAARGSQERTQLRQKIFKINELAQQFYQKNLLFNKDAATHHARAYLKKRGIDRQAVERFGMGFAVDQWDALMDHLKKHRVPINFMEKAGLIIGRQRSDGFYDRFRNRIIFPIMDVKGRCVAFGGRTLEADNPAKYINSPESPVYTKGQHLYGLPLAKDDIIKQDLAVIVEGYMDFMTPFLAGIRHLVASLGTALTLEQIRLIRRYTKNIVMLFDSDQAGQAATLRSLDILIEEGMHVKVATLDADTDPDAFIRRFGPDAFQERLAQARGLIDFKLQALLATTDRESIEGRAAIAEAMLPTIARFPNEIVKSEYVKKLARTLSVTPEALTAEMKKVNARDGRADMSSAAAPRHAAVTALPAAEKNILRLMLEDQDYIPLVQDELNATDFEHRDLQVIVAKIFELFSRDRQDFNPARLTGCFDDQRIVGIISSLMAAEDTLAGDKQKIHADCVQRLKQNRRKAKRRKLLHQIETAQSAGDQRAITRLLEQFNQLIKG